MNSQELEAALEYRKQLEATHMKYIGEDMSGMSNEQLLRDIRKCEEQDETGVEEAIKILTPDQKRVIQWRNDLKEKLSEMPSHIAEGPMLKGVHDAADDVKKAIDDLKKFI